MTTVELYCSKCGRTTTRFVSNRRLGGDESAEPSVCPCTIYLNLNDTINCTTADVSNIIISGGAAIYANVASPKTKLTKKVVISTGGVVSSVRSFKSDSSITQSRPDPFNNLDLTLFNFNAKQYIETQFTTLMLSTDDTVRRVSYRYRDCNRYPVRKELLEVKHVTYGVRLCKSMETKVLEHSREMGDWVVRQRSYTPGDTISVEVEYTKAGDPIATEVRNAITNYFSSYAVHTCLSQYLDRGFLEVVKLQRRKAYDGRPLPGRNYVFIPKADGEDSYIVESGMIHYVCRPDDNWTVTGFFANSIAFSSTQISRRPNTIRVESLIDGRLVFIDYVMNNFTGAREKLYRDISLLKRMVTNSSFARLPLVFRSYYKSLEMCEQSRQTCGYPTDGILAIDTANGVTTRIKKVCIDLIAVDGHLCAGSAGSLRPIASYPCQLREQFVYECELTIEKDLIYIDKINYRPDKLHPNSMTVCIDAIVVSRSKQFPHVLHIRNATSLSFVAKDNLYNILTNISVTSNLVIDVGSGRFQSWEQIRRTSKSYVFCEPKPKIPLELKKLFKDITSMSSESLVSEISTLCRTVGQHRLFVGTLQELLHRNGVRDLLLKCRVPLVFSFSVHHCYKEFVEYASDGGSVLALTHVYDRQSDDIRCPLRPEKVDGLKDWKSNTNMQLMPTSSSDSTDTESAHTTNRFKRDVTVFNQNGMKMELQLVNPPIGRMTLQYQNRFVERALFRSDFRDFTEVRVDDFSLGDEHSLIGIERFAASMLIYHN